MISTAISVLRKEGVVLHPTETCYGLTADVFSEQAVRKVYALKDMAESKPVSIMVSSLEEAVKYGNFSEKALELVREYWPGPLTIVVPRTALLPTYLNRGASTVGIRCPDHEITQDMLREFGGPLITTSANRTGEPQAYDVETFLIGRDADETGGSGIPDAIIDMGHIPAVEPSTIVEVIGDDMKVLRKGPIAL